MSKPSSVLFPSLVALFALPAWAATIDLPSAWLAVPPTETGGRVAWEGIVLPLGGTPLSAAVRNDRDFLYVRVRTSNATARRQICILGLTVWADGTGKSKKKYGVRFPVGVESFDGKRGGSPFGESPADVVPNAHEMLLIGPGEDDRVSVPAAGSGGASAKLDLAGDVLTLELAFPLRRTDERPLAVGAVPGSTMSIGFETEKPHFRGGGDGPPDGGLPGGPPGGMGRPGGGMGAPGGGKGGRGGTPGGEGRPSTPRPIKVWTRVTLATEPTAPH